MRFSIYLQVSIWDIYNLSDFYARNNQLLITLFHNYFTAMPM